MAQASIGHNLEIRKLKIHNLERQTLEQDISRKT